MIPHDSSCLVVFPLDNEDKYCILCQNIYWIIPLEEEGRGRGLRTRVVKETWTGVGGGED